MMRLWPVSAIATAFFDTASPLGTDRLEARPAITSIGSGFSFETGGASASAVVIGPARASTSCSPM